MGSSRIRGASRRISLYAGMLRVVKRPRPRPSPDDRVCTWKDGPRRREMGSGRADSQLFAAKLLVWYMKGAMADTRTTLGTQSSCLSYVADMLVVITGVPAD